MKNETRNQLIGFIAIILIIVIIFPYLTKNKSFSHNDIEVVRQTEHQNSHQSEPDVPVIVEDENQMTSSSQHNSELNIVDSLLEQTHENETTDSVNVVIPPTQQENTQQNTEIEKAYSIQLVALKNKQKIDELIALLRLNNYNVYTDPTTPKQNQITRLLVGPYSSREQAELVILDLKNLTKLDGFIVIR